MRYSLGTLIIAVIFIGALMGCWINRCAWRLDHTIASQPDCRIPYNSNLQFSPNGKQIFHLISGYAMLHDAESGALISKHELDCQGLNAVNYKTTGDFEFFGIELKLQRYFTKPPSAALAQLKTNDPYLYRHDDRDNQIQWVWGKNCETDREVHNWVKKFEPHGIFFIDDPCHDQCTSVGCFSPDGTKYVYPCRYIDKEFQSIIRIMNVADGQILDTLPTGIISNAARFSPDGKRLALLNNNGIAIWQRTRPSGLLGWLTFPLFWIAVASGLALAIRLVRSMGKYRQPQLRSDGRVKVQI